MPVKAFTPQRIAQVDNDQYAVAFEDKDEALMCLRKNPRAACMELETGEWVLVYNSSEIDLKRAVLKH